jgi:hypothetical protein
MGRFGNKGEHGAKPGRSAADGADSTSSDWPAVELGNLLAGKAYLSSDAQTAFVRLLCRDEGWLRAVPHNFGEVVYFKWKWSRGRWAGNYVMWVCADYDFSAALVGLYMKVLAVEGGRDRPVKDTAYDTQSLP